MVDSELAYQLDRIMEEDVKTFIDDRDINHLMSGGFIVKTTLGSHILLRELLERVGAFDIIHYTVTGDKIYVAKWHELSNEKKAEIRGKTRR